ncbi:MAG TPA: inositol monophosphatase family protein [Gemmatimonadaceae bacterium]
MSASDASQGNRSATVSTSTAIRAERRALLATCVAAAARAADVVRSGADRRDSLTWEVKGKHDFVTTVDRDSEAVIHEIVAQRHPDATILAEEGSPDASTTRGLVFVADPLDGTTNFLHGVPWYAVSIAALVDGEIMAGAVVNAATGALYTATAGGGARLAGAPIRVSDVSDPSRALIATGFPFSRDDEIARYIRMAPAVMRATSGLRRAGAAALDLADVAAGRYEAFWELRLAPWDVAAGLLLVREAGGIATDLAGVPAKVQETAMVAGSPVMHQWLLATLQNTE